MALAATRFIENEMTQQGITADFALGGITSQIVKMHEAGLVKKVLDVQGFDYANADWQGGLLENLADASISRDVLDEAVRRVLRVKFELGLFEDPYLPEGREEQNFSMALLKEAV